jgi:hypothetical protein
MPVRKIPLRYSSLSGEKSSIKNNRRIQFESSLEADFIDLLEWDRNVKFYEEQPFKIEFFDENQKPRYYIPDFLVVYYDSVLNEKNLPIIFEVKYSRDLEIQKEKLSPKFKAAKHFCKQENFFFKIITEKEIRTPFLENIKFLKKYRKTAKDNYIKEVSSHLIELLEKFDVSTPEILIASVSRTDEIKAVFLYNLWILISNGVIAIDMTKKITMESKIWIP